MPIDMPPVVDHNDISVEVHASKEVAQSGMTIVVNGETFVITGNKYLTPNKIQELAENTEQGSSFAKNLQKAYRDTGHPFIYVTHLSGADGQKIISVSEKKISKLSGDEKAAQYFEHLVDKECVTESHLRQAAANANRHAQRSGMRYELSYNSLESSELEMVLEEKAIEGYKPGSIAIGLKNARSEYQGEHQAYLLGEYSFKNGIKVSSSFATTIDSDEGPNVISDANEASIQIDHAGKLGVFGVEIYAAQYEIPFEQVSTTPGDCLIGSLFCFPSTQQSISDKIKGAVYQAELFAKQDGYIHGKSSVSFAESVVRVEASAEADSEGVEVADESFTQVNFSAQYEHRNDETLVNANLGVHYAFDYSSSTSNPWVTGVSKSTSDIESAEYLTLGAGLERRLKDNFFVGGNIRGQYADSDLPVQSKFRLGGDYGLHAMNENVLRGDSGYLAMAKIGADTQWKGIDFAASLFAEAGGVSQSSGGNAKATDYGVALSAEGSHLATQLIYAIPLEGDDIESLSDDSGSLLWNIELKL